MEFLKDVLHGKMRGIAVNKAAEWGLEVLNDMKTTSLTTDLVSVYTEQIFACQWIQTARYSGK